jgi:hypothetical protein
MRLLLLLLAALTLAPPAWACSCVYGSETEEASMNHLNSAAFIVKARVLKVEPPPFAGELPPYEMDSYPARGNPAYSKVFLEVEKIYKGDKNIKTLTAYFDVMSSCGVLYVPWLFNNEINKRDFLIFYESDGDYIFSSFCSSYISENHQKQLREGTFAFSEPQQTTLKESGNGTQESYFKNSNDLEVWFKKRTPDAEIENFSFKGKKFIKISFIIKENNKEKSSDHNSSGHIPVGSSFYLYALEEDGASRKIFNVSEYNFDIGDGTMPPQKINLRQNEETLQVVMEKSGEVLESFHISDLLGQSCQKDEHCLDGYYCLKNDYFKPRGLCSPCAEADPAAPPAGCAKK